MYFLYNLPRTDCQIFQQTEASCKQYGLSIRLICYANVFVDLYPRHEIKILNI